MKSVTRSFLQESYTKYNEELLPYFLSAKYELFVEKVLENSYLLIYSEKSKALMPIRKYLVKNFALIQIIYPPVTISGLRLSADEEGEFLEEFVLFVKEKKMAIRIIQSYSYCVFKAVPAKSVSCAFGTYIIDIKKFTEEELFSKIDSKGRNKIRNAQKNEVSLKWEAEVLEDFYDLYRKTMERSNINLESFEYFDMFVKHIGESNILCGVSYLKGKPQAALLIAYTEYSGYYLYGTMAEKMENPGAMDYLQWEAIRLLKKKKVRKYDLVGARTSNIRGTKLEGIQNFKKKFGGDLMNGYLWKMDINVVKCRVFDSLLKISNKLKGTLKHMDIIDEERLKLLSDNRNV